MVHSFLAALSKVRDAIHDKQTLQFCRKKRPCSQRRFAIGGLATSDQQLKLSSKCRDATGCSKDPPIRPKITGSEPLPLFLCAG